MEAASGFEPLHKGFADLSLGHLGTPPIFELGVLSFRVWELKKLFACFLFNSELITLNS